jgi:hypothetical protein
VVKANLEEHLDTVSPGRIAKEERIRLGKGSDDLTPSPNSRASPKKFSRSKNSKNFRRAKTIGMKTIQHSYMDMSYSNAMEHRIDRDSKNIVL